MTMRAKKLTPEAMISARRRSAGIPNKSGLILYTVSWYDFSTHQQHSEICVLDPRQNETTVLVDDGKSASPTWINDNEIALLRSTDDGSTELVVGKVADFKQTSYVVETIDAAANELKVVKLKDDLYGVALSAPASLDGSPFNAQKQPKIHSSGKLYRSLFVRHWDQWIRPQKQSIWYAELFRAPESCSEPRAIVTDKGERYYLSPLVNALKGTGLESPYNIPAREGDFDIAKAGLVFIAKHPGFNPALSTICNLYVVPLRSFRETTPFIYAVNLDAFTMHGAITSPSFSADGKSIAFLAMKENGYEADRNRIFVLPDISRPSWINQMLATEDPDGKWNRSPQAIKWSKDGQALFLVAEEHGRSRLWNLSSNPLKTSLPKLLSVEGSIQDFHPLENGSVFVSGSSLTDNSFYSVLETTNSPAQLISSNSHCGASFGLSHSQIDDIWFEGATNNFAEEGHLVHAWVIKPSNFDKDRKYPLAFLVHGGPQGAWLDSWATRWNPAVYAEQGYVVVTPNPTGSTGYGQPFCDSIKQNWGGLPYEDLVKCFEYLENSVDYIDTANSVALGASYGGYMMNWMQGHPLGKKFKALVCHDGIFSTLSALSTEELYFPIRDLGGPWSENKSEWLKWDPAQHTQNWTTPMLVIHNELDYRLTMGEGLAAFNILKSQGIRSEFLTFPDENHFVLKPENALKWYTAILNFINPFVGLPVYKKESLDEIIQDPLPEDQKQSRIIMVK